ncbi:GNAT family N-acetyltransferase [Leifsonia sp. fls2-241-R2A-40a]|uniref:GNAT family N-acetyltransferase n=1 Tax=Leifsonia sp. fls2-241-R2A-40a TaxID=3040290 RepID=UPI002550B662|nr:GNAT family N-acetyltransferase [Leifsonia sp. fls2-241-R2A-40a]
MSIEVLPATGRWDDFASFMVPRKPGGGGCVCMSYRQARLGMPERIQYMHDECTREPGPGVLAYVDDRVAGWCSVAPKATYARLLRSRTIPHLDEDRDPWSIVCFVVRAGFRGRGLMHELLDGAVEHARESGATMVEGYPVDTDGRVDVISGYVGTVSLFESHGFARRTITEAHSGGATRWLMRRELG